MQYAITLMADTANWPKPERYRIVSGGAERSVSGPLKHNCPRRLFHFGPLWGSSNSPVLQEMYKTKTITNIMHLTITDYLVPNIRLFLKHLHTFCLFSMQHIGESGIISGKKNNFMT